MQIKMCLHVYNDYGSCSKNVIKMFKKLLKKLNKILQQINSYTHNLLKLTMTIIFFVFT